MGPKSDMVIEDSVGDIGETSLGLGCCSYQKIRIELVKTMLDLDRIKV